MRDLRGLTIPAIALSGVLPVVAHVLARNGRDVLHSPLFTGVTAATFVAVLLTILELQRDVPARVESRGVAASGRLLRWIAGAPAWSQLLAVAALAFSLVGSVSLHAERKNGFPDESGGRRVLRIGSRVMAELSDEEWQAIQARRSVAMTGFMLAFPALASMTILGKRRDD